MIELVETGAKQITKSDFLEKLQTQKSEYTVLISQKLSPPLVGKYYNLIEYHVIVAHQFVKERRRFNKGNSIVSFSARRKLKNVGVGACLMRS